MAETIKVTDSIRDFSKLLYAETVSSVEQIFDENSAYSDLKLSGVRVCCGTESINHNHSQYFLPETTPWLVELYFGLQMLGERKDESILFLSEPSSCVAAWPCDVLQGIEKKWVATLALSGVNSVARLAAISHEQLLVFKQQFRSNRVFEFYRKAQIALQPSPFLPVTALDSMKFFEILSLSTERMLSIAPALTTRDVLNITAFLGGLAAVIKDRYLKPKTLREFLNS